jgi:hypothetical protein
MKSNNYFANLKLLEKFFWSSFQLSQIGFETKYKFEKINFNNNNVLQGR